MNATSTVRGQKVCSTKRVTSAARGGFAVQRESVLSVLERQKVCIIKNVTSAVRGDKVCSIKRVAPGVCGEGLQ